MIVSLDEVYDEINDIDPSGTDDNELQGFIDGAHAVIESLVGPVDAATKDEWYDGGAREIYLRSRPVITVTSIIEYTPSALTLTAEPFGTDPYTGSGYRLDNVKGVLLRTSGGLPTSFAGGTGNVHVVYEAGRVEVPANIRLGMLELIRSQWQPQQSGNLPGIGGSDDFTGVNVLGFFVPNRVMELLSPSRQVLC